MTERYLRENQVAELLGRGLSTLRRDRMEGRGIPYIKMARQVRYRASDVERFVERHLVQTGDSMKNKGSQCSETGCCTSE
jgi:predicted DNA-binding transcriptional regulator AlpA